MKNQLLKYLNCFIILILLPMSLMAVGEIGGIVPNTGSTANYSSRGSPPRKNTNVQSQSYTTSVNFGDDLKTVKKTTNTEIPIVYPSSAPLPGTGFTHTYTTDLDFATGTLTGLEYDTVPNQLQLSQEHTTLPFIWVLNQGGESGVYSVSKLNTDTGEELGRYRIGFYNSAESRTTVDSQGNCWIGTSRGTVVKIGHYENGQWIDRNGDGICQTSQDLDGNGIIEGSEMLPWGQDECVFFEVVLVPGYEGTYVPGTYYGTDFGYSIKGLSTDASDNIWAAIYSPMLYYIDGLTGEILRNVDYSEYNIWGNYQTVIDSNGILWGCQWYHKCILRFDPSTDAVSTMNLNHEVWGLGLDNSNHLFATGSSADHIKGYLSRIDVLTNTLDRQVWFVPGYTYCIPRGITCTSDNHVWVSDMYTNRIFEFDNDATLLNHQQYIGLNGPTGISVDVTGKIWVVGYSSRNIIRIDPTTHSTDLMKPRAGGIGGALTFGDMTGMIDWTDTTPIGTWTVDCDSGSAATQWNAVSWTSDEPADTSVSVKVRSSNDQSSWSSWVTAINGHSLSVPVIGRYLQIETTLQSISEDASPILYDLTVTGNRPPVADATGPYTVDEGFTIIFDASSSADPDGDPLQYRWDYENDGTWDTDWSTSSTASHTFLDDWTGSVKVEVSDGELIATAIARVTVNNVAPAVSAAADQTIDEGTAISLDLATFTDPGILDTHAAIINWDDSTIEAGSVWELAGDGTVSGSHIYAEDGIYTVTLTVTDDDGGADTDTLTVTVNNVAPIADAGTDQTADEGAEVSFSGSCTDPGWFDTHVYSWDFGDGSPATTESDDSTATHVYGDNGVYTVTLTVTDDDGGVGTDTLTVTVYNVAPTIEAGDDQVVYSGDTVSFNGSFSDPGLLDTHTIVWDLGDGTSVTDTLTFDHIYLVANTYTVTLTVTDDDGGIGMDTLTVTVQRIPIVIDIKPGCPDNVINPGSNGVIRVAILDDGTFDVTLINLDTVAFGPGKAHPIRYKFQDWDHDGDIDLMLWFRTQDTGIEVGDTSAILDADLTDGRQLRGEDQIQTVPPEHTQTTKSVLSSDNKRTQVKY